MSLTLHHHPLSSFCQKVSIGLYELEVPFGANLVDLGDPAQRAALVKLWPFGKFPAIHDASSGAVVAESTTILEWLDARAGGGKLIPRDAERAARVRFLDRILDLHVHLPMQKAVGDKLRPEGSKDPVGVAQAKAQIATSYDWLEMQLNERDWAAGPEFTMADCAAAPALQYAQHAVAFGERPRLSAYYERLTKRPSFARVLAEAKPYWEMFPGA